MSKPLTRIMYIEDKLCGLSGPAQIGRVTFSKSMRSVHYDGRTFCRIGSGYKYNFFEEGTGAEFWISGPKRNGEDRLYPTNVPVTIDDDVVEEYWRDIRGIGTKPPK